MALHLATITCTIAFLLHQTVGNDMANTVTRQTCSYTFNVPHEDGCSITDGVLTQIQTTVNELHSQVTSLLQQNTDLLQHNIQLLEDNSHWRQLAERKLEDLGGNQNSVHRAGKT